MQISVHDGNILDYGGRLLWVISIHINITCIFILPSSHDNIQAIGEQLALENPQFLSLSCQSGFGILPMQSLCGGPITPRHIYTVCVVRGILAVGSGSGRDQPSMWPLKLTDLLTVNITARKLLTLTLFLARSKRSKLFTCKKTQKTASKFHSAKKKKTTHKPKIYKAINILSQLVFPSPPLLGNGPFPKRPIRDPKNRH